MIVYDGECVMCSAWVRFVVKRDRDALFSYTAIQSPLGRSLAQAFGVDPEDAQTNIVILGGKAHFKADAALAVFRRLPGWTWTSVAQVMPRPVRNWLYSRIANNRYRLFGRQEACLVLDASVQDRFLK